LSSLEWRKSIFLIRPGFLTYSLNPGLFAWEPWQIDTSTLTVHRPLL
jgi:hypothetical protein